MTARAGAWIEDLTWPDVAAGLEAGATVIVPVGAKAKEHGHHLPMQTDYLLARALCDGIAARLPVLIAPVIDVGYYPAFSNYPGSQHLRPETFMALVEDVLEGFVRHGVRRIAIVNTGVSTAAPIRIVVRTILARHGIRVAVADIETLGKKSRAAMTQRLGGHGDEHETSILLAVAPERVDLAKAVPDYGQGDEPETVFYRPVVFRDDPASGPDYSRTGVRGDPTLATPEKGRVILYEMIEDLVGGLELLGDRP